MLVYSVLFIFHAFSASALDIGNAQKVAESLVFHLKSKPNGCLNYDDFPVSMPSKNLAALWIRGAFHEAGTFDPRNSGNPGGIDGSLTASTSHPANEGLFNSTAELFVNRGGAALPDPIKSQVSRSDMRVIGALAGIKHCGGPDIAFRGGRRDIVNPIVSNYKRLPGPREAYSSVKDKFLRMGLTLKEMAVLGMFNVYALMSVTGSHSMGGVHSNGRFTAFDDTPGVFDNHVFQRSVKNQCALRIDCQIANDPDLRPFIQLFANNQSAFFAEYATAFEKMTTLTSSPLDAQPRRNDEKMIAANKAQGAGSACPFSMGRGPARLCPNQPQSVVVEIANEVNSVVNSVHHAVEGAVTDIIGQILG